MTATSRMWNESDDRKFVAFYMEKLRRGQDVFHDLIEAPGGSGIIPILVEEFRCDADSKVRTALIEVVSQFHLRTSIPFFAEALRDTSPCVWKAALDALVAFPCRESLTVLESAITTDDEQRSWISEAADQVREQVEKETKA